MADESKEQSGARRSSESADRYKAAVDVYQPSEVDDDAHDLLHSAMQALGEHAQANPAAEQPVRQVLSDLRNTLSAHMRREQISAMTNFESFDAREHFKRVNAICEGELARAKEKIGAALRHAGVGKAEQAAVSSALDEHLASLRARIDERRAAAGAEEHPEPQPENHEEVKA